MTKEQINRAIEAERRNAHREGYELARKEAAQIGWHLRAYDHVMSERVL